MTNETELTPQQKRQIILNNSQRAIVSIITTIVNFERKMDIFLSRYFGRDSIRKNELGDLIFFTERITLDQKRQIFEIIIKKHFKDFLIENPNFLNSIRYMIPHRNIVAHSEVDLYSSDAVENYNTEVYFKKYKNGKLTLIKYDPNEIKKLEENSKEIFIGSENLLELAMSPQD